MATNLRDMSTCFVSAVAVTLAAATDSHAGGFIRLNFIDEGNQTSALDVTDSVINFRVVGTARDSEGFDQAVIWSPASIDIPLGDLPGGVALSRGRGISGDGLTAVGDGITAFGQEAFRWTAETDIESIGDLPLGSVFSTANAANANGTVIVGQGQSLKPEAFRWTMEGMEPLGFLPDGTASGANAVSADGNVVVGFAAEVGNIGAFRWTPEDGMRPLDTTPNTITTVSAHDVSADGTTVVGEGVREGVGPEAFLWTQEGGVQGLGHLPGAFSSEARGVSANGDTVVGRAMTTAGNTAFIWDAVNGMQPLQDVLFDAGISTFPVPVLTEATGISADGSVIVGNGLDSGGRSVGWAATLAAIWTGQSASKSWDKIANWFDLNLPATNENVVLITQSPTTITGSTLDRSIGSIIIGSQTPGITTLSLDVGTIDASRTVTIQSSGALTGHGILIARAGITNLGRISLDAGGQLTGQTLTNKGLILPGGDLYNSLDNTPDGEVRVSFNQTLTFHAPQNHNHGQINLLNGFLTFERELHNHVDGRVTGLGQLIVNDGLTNDGNVTITGDTLVVGDVDNTSSGTVLVTGLARATFFNDVHSNGQFRVSPASTAVILGDFSGTGGASGGGTILFEGGLSPGDSTAALNIAANVVTGPVSQTTLEINGQTPGVEHDQINVAGHVILSGTLHIETQPGLLVTTGDRFTLLTYQSRGGTFDLITGTLLDTTLALAPLFTDTGSDDNDDALVFRASIPGDLNFDGKVSVADLSVLALNFNANPGLYVELTDTNSWELGDFNADGRITVADLSLLALNFGTDLSDPSSSPTPLSVHAAAALVGIDAATIPEPSALVVLTTVVMTVSLRRGAC